MSFSKLVALVSVLALSLVACTFNTYEVSESAAPAPSGSTTTIPPHPTGSTPAPSSSSPSVVQPSEAFSILSVNIAIAKGSDGSDVVLNMRDVYVRFSAPARDVKVYLFEKPSGKFVMSYAYRDYLYQPGQMSFALMVSGLCPWTQYEIIVEGEEIGTGKHAFSSVSFLATDVPGVLCN